MKLLAAILVGPIQYIEIPLGTAFVFDDCWNVMNDQRETQENQANIISLAARLRGQVQAEAICFKLLAPDGNR